MKDLDKRYCEIRKELSEYDLEPMFDLAVRINFTEQGYESIKDVYMRNDKTWDEIDDSWEPHNLLIHSKRILIVLKRIYLNIIKTGEML